MPPARQWHATRPGEIFAGEILAGEIEAGNGAPGRLRGSPGPSGGFALTLAARAKHTWILTDTEHLEDAVAVVAELAMKRASLFGRAPAQPDVDTAAKIMGYHEARPEAFTQRRAAIVHDCDHNYERRRSFIDSIDVALLKLAPNASSETLPDFLAAAPHH